MGQLNFSLPSKYLLYRELNCACFWNLLPLIAMMLRFEKEKGMESTNAVLIEVIKEKKTTKKDRKKE
jgi:hypothetical protein